MSDSNIESTLNERRVFPPPARFSSRATVSSMEMYESMYRRSLDDPDTFWSEIASELEWFEPWKEVLRWEEPFAQWFVGGKTNLSHNCLDRHLTTWRKNRVALLWEGEPGDVRVLTYQMLHREVCRFAKRAGVIRSRTGRSSDHLSGYGAGTAHRDACLCPTRSYPQRGVRGVQFGGAPGPYQ